MISPNTAQTLFEELGKNENKQAFSVLFANAFKKEPYLASYITAFFALSKIDNPCVACLLGVALYHEMMRRQDEADELNEQYGKSN